MLTDTIRFTDFRNAIGDLAAQMPDPRLSPARHQFWADHETKYAKLVVLDDSEAITMRHGDQGEARKDADKGSGQDLPIQHTIQILQRELNNFNERIAELESVGHRGRTIVVLKANALDFARQIDELRAILVEGTTKGQSRILSRDKSKTPT